MKIYPLPMSIRVRELRLVLRSRRASQEVYIPRLNYEEGRVRASFSYARGRFRLRGNLKGRVERELLRIENLSLISRRFWASVRGRVGERIGRLTFFGAVNPVKTKHFEMDALYFRGEAQINFPFLHGFAYVVEPFVRVRGKKYEHLRGVVGGHFKLFERLLLSGFVEGEEVKIWAHYSAIPENSLRFSFSELSVDEEVIGLRLPFRSLWSGEGSFSLREKKLQVRARSGELFLAGETFERGELSFSYNLPLREGLLDLNLTNGGLANLRLALKGKELKGNFILKTLRLTYKGLGLSISGIGEFEKKEKFRLRASYSLQEISARGLSLPDLSGRLTLMDGFVKTSLRGEGIRALLWGRPPALEGRLTLRNFGLSLKGATLLVREGKGEFSLKKPLRASLDLHSDLFFKERALERDVNLRITLKDSLLKLLLSSASSRGRLSYSLEKKEGSFSLRRRDKLLTLSTKGNVKGAEAEGNLELLLRLGEDLIPLNGNFSLRRDSLSFRLNRRTFRGKVLSYEFGGVNLSLEGGRLKGRVGGLRLFLLGRPLLEVSQASLEGSPSAFQFTPINVSGIFRGKILLGKEEEFFVDGEGILDLGLLSNYVSSLIRSRLEGKVRAKLRAEGGSFSLLLDTERPLRVKSEFFYEPFTTALTLSASEKNLQLSLSSWFSRGFLVAYALSEDYRNFTVFMDFEKAPLRFVDGVRARILADGKGRLEVENLKELKLYLRTSFDGYVQIEKGEGKAKRKKEDLPVEVNLEFSTKKGLEIKIPEGRILATLRGKVYGRLPRVNYLLEANLRAGQLSYFGRDFFLKNSRIEAVREGDKEEVRLSLSLNTYLDGYKVFLKVSGTKDSPEVYYFSEPPLSREEILLSLIGGSSGEGLLPVGEALTRELRTVGTFKGYLERLLDVKISFGVMTTSTGEIGAYARLRKNLGRFLSLVYQTSSLQERRSNYLGAVLTSPGNLDLVFQFNVYSDSSREYKFRYIKEFDF